MQRFIRINILITKIYRTYKCTRINRVFRFIRINRTYNFIEINRTNKFKSINRMHRFAKINRMYQFKTITSTHRVTKINRVYRFTRANRTYRFTKVKRTCLLGLTRGKVLQTLTGRTRVQIHCKLSSIETLVSQALIDMEISHEEFNVIIREKINERMKEKECEECH